MSDFKDFEDIFNSGNLNEICRKDSGLLWLKVKSISRKELLNKFTNSNNIVLSSKKDKDRFPELFNLLNKNLQSSHKLLNDFIVKENTLQISNVDTDKIISELYKLKNFNWGGDYQNSLDKYLVSRFVKTYYSYSELISKFETDINIAVQGYVFNSWYNHWSSILIENIFKSNESVLPSLGQIKSVDFFINNIPFDLKVTYLPEEFIKQKRKEKGLAVELTYLKSKAKELGVTFDKSAKDSDILYEITEKLKERNDNISKDILNQLSNERIKILNDAQQNPKILAKWLYENQGQMRFGSENRIFLILVDTDDFTSSWKLKRNIEFLKRLINKYIDNFNKKHIEQLELDFIYNNKSYKVLTDVVFAVKSNN